MPSEFHMNTDAMRIGREQLAEAIRQRSEVKRQVLADYDARYGKDRVWISSYMENIALPELFGYDMNDLYRDPALGLEMELRYRLFWLDNSWDDCIPGRGIESSVGMYFDLTLFGQEVGHSAGGVPQFGRHALADRPDLSALPAEVDFYSSGVMPQLIQYHRDMQEIARRWYGDEITIGMREFLRGPTDIYVVMRGYENFIADTIERPQFVQELMSYFVTQRARWNAQRQQFVGGTPSSPQVHDDWVNVPFISPEIFRDFIVPAYRELQEKEGPVTYFHTCGVMTPVVRDLLEIFPKIESLNISGWNDVQELDRLVDPSISFDLNMINTFVLSGTRQQHCDMLGKIAEVKGRRKLTVCAQAIVKLHDTLEEDLARMNGFIELARQRL